MPLKVSSELRGASIQEKISKLSEFVRNDLEMCGAPGSVRESRDYLLIARSPQSPVAQALLAHASLLAAAGVTIRALFTDLEPYPMGSGEDAFAFPGECRVVRDSRLLAAHEQLVLGPTCAWIGDCMRREPTKRDAFEHFAAECNDTAANAVRSFERMWQIAIPVETTAQFPGALASQLPEMTAPWWAVGDRSVNDR